MALRVTILPNPELSIIVAVYNEDPRNLVKLLDRLDACLEPLVSGFEVVFVNDGSRPPTTEALRQLAVSRQNIKLVEFSRNFGQQAAITAGLDHAVGEVVVNMDSDLQDPPELIPKMLVKWKEGFDVVYATRSKRRDRVLKRVTAHIFYRVLGAISSIEIPWDTGDFRLMDRKVVRALSSLPEKTRFIRGMVPWLGFRQCGIPLDRDARELGDSTYTVKKLLALALDGLLAFSIAPLIFLPFVGLILSVLGLLSFAIALVLNGAKLDAAAILSFATMLTGLVIVSVGIVAVYLSRVLEEVRARPTYLVGTRMGAGFIDSGSEQDQRVSRLEMNESNKTVSSAGRSSH